MSIGADGGEALEGDVCAGIGRGLVAVSSELVGVCDRTLEMTVAYVKDRKQFGVPVGSYQAVSHRCAQMLLDTEKAALGGRLRGLGRRRRARRCSPRPPRWPRPRARRPAARSPRSAIQAHGGIGFTWEADVHWLYKRAQIDAALLGGAKRHRAQLALDPRRPRRRLRGGLSGRRACLDRAGR